MRFARFMRFCLLVAVSLVACGPAPEPTCTSTSCGTGKVCNPNTGLCETGPAPTTVCQESPGGGLRCVPVEIPTVAQQQPGHEPSIGPLGVSPATGSAPTPPAEASPKPPGTP